MGSGTRWLAGCLLVAGCSVGTVGLPPPGGDAGVAVDARTAVDAPRRSDTAPAVSAADAGDAGETDGGREMVRSCTNDVTERYSFQWSLYGYAPSVDVAPGCRVRAQLMGFGAPVEPACEAVADLGALAAALRDPVVERALAEGGYYGGEPVGNDSDVAFSIWRGDAEVTLGRDCGWPSDACRPVPLQLRRVEDLVRELIREAPWRGGCVEADEEDGP